MKQGIVIELGLQGSRSGSCSRRRKSMSGLFDELPDNKETSAVKSYGSRVLTRGMLRRERVPQGVMWPVRPVPHTPSHTGGE